MDEHVEVTVRYELGHSYVESWTRTQLYCPACGKRTVWGDNGMGDVEMGPVFLCECGAAFYSPTEPRPGDLQDQQRLAAFRGEDPTRVNVPVRLPRPALRRALDLLG